MQVPCVLYVHNVFLTVFNMAAGCLLLFMSDMRVHLVKYCTYVYTCPYLFVYMYILVQICMCIVDIFVL